MERTASLPRKSDAIFSAVLTHLAEHGYDALTVESVAAHAGVNKTTIYRTWATKDELLADALLRAPELTFEFPDTGSLRGDLTALAEQITGLLTEPATRRIAEALITASPDRPATAEAARRFFADRLHREQSIFERARERGELRDQPHAEMIVDVIGGTLWFHSLVRTRPMDDAFLQELIETALHGIAPRDAG